VKLQFFKPFLWILIIVVFAISLACGGPPETEEPPPTFWRIPSSTAEEQDTKTTEEPRETEEPGGESDIEAISRREDAQGAVIQIESQGTFVDPEFGLVSGAGHGSGFIIDPTGIAVTNNHVVTGAGLLKVWVGGDTSKTYNAKVLGVSECSDLAVIDIEGEGFPYFEWYEGSINVGLEVYALGFPLGEREFTLTRGVVSKASAPGETDWASVDSVIGHDATINPGNSGGPLIDNDGKVVAVNYRGRPEFNQYFAISAERAIPLVERMRAGEDVNSIGVNGSAVVSEDGSLSGVWVSSVKSGSPADQSGLQGGDVILLMEGLTLGVDGTMSDYCDILRSHGPEDTLAMEVLRFATEEVLEGQINGRQLELAYSFAEEIPPDEEEVIPGDFTYATVIDDSGAIQMDVPSHWNQIDGSYWQTTWGDAEFIAASISASANLDFFYGTYGEPGVFFAASDRLGQLGGYVQLLDGTKVWYEDDCVYDSRDDYVDEFYEGKYDFWTNCGAENGNVFILSARPIDDPLAFLILVEVRFLTSEDLDSLTRILQTFDVVGSLP
jgi:serine protease Do